MFDIISDLDNDDNFVNSQYQYDPIEISHVDPQSISSFSDVGSPVHYPDHLPQPSPENQIVNMPDPNYVYFDNNNIGYSYDSNTGTYIPVTVTVGENVYPQQSMNGYNYTTSGDMRSYYVSDDENIRPRKRKRKSKVDLPAPNNLKNVKDYEDSLIALDSQTFDEYVEGAYQYRKYSEEEKEYFRDLRRRIKNRESARKSRMNKRTKLDTLSGQVKDLNDHTMLLQQENDSLKRENSQLKNEVIYLKNVISTYSYGNHGNNNTVKEEEPSSSKSISTHSILLFVLLFSFGILWNLDVSIFSTSIIQNTKSQFLSQTIQPPKSIDDPTLDQLWENIQKENQGSENNQDNPNYQHLKKDVEICCF